MAFSDAVKAAARDRDGFACRCCGLIDRSIDVDHRAPMARGGDDSLANAQCLCAVCNRQIKNSTYVEFDKPCPVSKRWAIPESARKARRLLQMEVNKQRKEGKL